MSIAWIRYEIRVLGTAARLGPLLAIAGIGLIALLMETSGATRQSLANALTATVELGIPLVVGILATSIASADRAIELQRSVQTSYRTTLLRRIGLLTAWSTVLALTVSVLLDVSGYWIVPGSLVVGQLAWLAPLLWFTGAGVLLAATTHSWSASVALIGGIWVVQNMFVSWFLDSETARHAFLFMTTHAPGAGDWTSTRISVAIIGLFFAGLGVIIRSRSEHIDVGGNE